MATRLKQRLAALVAPFFDHVLLPTDTTSMRVRKISVVLYMTAAWLATLCVVVATLLAGRWLAEGYGLFWTWVCIVMVMGPVNVIYIYVTQSVTDAAFACYAVQSTIILTLLDLHQASKLHMRGVPLFVIVVDIMLVGRMPQKTALFFVALFTAWMVIMVLESWLRFGIMDLPGTATDEQRRSVVMCEAPPCPAGLADAMMDAVVPVFCFMMDFYITRRFAQEAEGEQRRMAAAISACADIATALADFDLEAATDTLDAHLDNLPAEFVAASNRQLFNLGQYRPYIPLFCLNRRGGRGDATSATNQSRDAERPHVSPDIIGNDGDSFVTQSSWYTQPPSPAESVHSTEGDAAVNNPTYASYPGADVRGRSIFLNSGEQSPPGAHPKQRSMISRMVAATHGQEDLRASSLRGAKVTLMQLTSYHTEILNADLSRYITQHESILGHALHSCQRCCGVLETFLGDRILASFNAFRPVATHGASAVAALKMFVALTVEVDAYCFGVLASGKVHVGVLGTDDLRRPAIVGRLPDTLYQMERYAVSRRKQWICDHRTFFDASTTHEMAILLDQPVFDSKQPRRQAPHAGWATPKAGGGGAAASSTTHTSISAGGGGIGKDAVQGPGVHGVVEPAGSSGVDASASADAATLASRRSRGMLSVNCGQASPRSPRTTSVGRRVLCSSAPDRGRAPRTPTSMCSRVCVNEFRADHALYEIIVDPSAPLPLSASQGSAKVGEEGAAEWMYQISASSAARWEVYNDAGMKFLLQGAAAAEQVLVVGRASPEFVMRFNEAAAAARTVHLGPFIEAADAIDRSSISNDVHSISNTSGTETLPVTPRSYRSMSTPNLAPAGGRPG